MNPLLLLLVPLFGAADRALGMYRDAKKTKGLKAGVLAVAVSGGALVLYLAADNAPLGAMLGGAWWLYRAPIPFFNGSATPQKGSQYVAAAAHHLLVLVPGLLAAYWGAAQVPVFAAAFVSYAAVAFVLALLYGRELTEAQESGEGIGDQNTFIEIARGAAFGLAMAGALAWHF